MPKPQTGSAYDSDTPPERFTDSGFAVVDWTPEMVLQVAGVDPVAPHDAQIEALRDAIDADDTFTPEMVDVLTASGYPELAHDPDAPGFTQFEGKTDPEETHG